MSHQPSLFDDCDPPAQQHSPTSQAAAEAIAPVAGRLRRRVYEHLLSVGVAGCTDEEGIAALGMSASTYRPRRIECVEAGLVRDSGRTRKTKSGRQAVVWVVAVVKTEEAA
jgi:hypothetical protein